MVKVQARKPVAVDPTDATSIWTSQNPVFSQGVVRQRSAICWKSRSRTGRALPPEHLQPMPVEEADWKRPAGSRGPTELIGAATHLSSNLFFPVVILGGRLRRRLLRPRAERRPAPGRSRRLGPRSRSKRHALPPDAGRGQRLVNLAAPRRQSPTPVLPRRLHLAAPPRTSTWRRRPRASRPDPSFPRPP